MAAKKKAKAVKKPTAAKKGATIADVRRLSLALPETSERLSYGTPAFFVAKKLFARILDETAIAVKVSYDQREVMVASRPELFVVTPHYQNWPMVIVQLGPLPLDLLQEVLEEAWRMEAPAKLRALHG